MKPLKQNVSVTLDEEIVRQIKDLSEESDRSFSQFVNLVLRDYLCEHDRPIPHTDSKKMQESP